jgi:serine/threonine protein kinase
VCAHAGTNPGLSFSLHYAPPEVVAAVEAKEKSGRASTATDMWALGVVAFELLTRTRAFQPRTPTGAIRDQLMGRKPLPWESKDRAERRALLRQLRILKPSVMACLSRRPEERPTAEDLLRNWNRLFDHVTAATSPTASASIK